MMTREQVMQVLEQVGEDVEVWVRGDGDVSVTIQDFEGFDEDWEEIDRDYDCEAIDVMEAALEEGAQEVYGDYYRYYDFGTFTVCVGYASMDI